MHDDFVLKNCLFCALITREIGSLRFLRFLSYQEHQNTSFDLVISRLQPYIATQLRGEGLDCSGDVAYFIEHATSSALYTQLL